MPLASAFSQLLTSKTVFFMFSDTHGGHSHGGHSHAHSLGHDGEAMHPASYRAAVVNVCGYCSSTLVPLTDLARSLRILLLFGDLLSSNNPLTGWYRPSPRPLSSFHGFGTSCGALAGLRHPCHVSQGAPSSKGFFGGHLRIGARSAGHNAQGCQVGSVSNHAVVRHGEHTIRDLLIARHLQRRTCDRGCCWQRSSNL